MCPGGARQVPLPASVSVNLRDFNALRRARVLAVGVRRALQAPAPSMWAARSAAAAAAGGAGGGGAGSGGGGAPSSAAAASASAGVGLEAMRSAMGRSGLGRADEGTYLGLEQQLRDLLDTWDHRSAGLSTPAFIKFFEARGYRNLPLQRLFEVLDSDGSGTIDSAELMSGIAALRDDHEALRICFRIFDTDGSGCLTIDEIAAMLRIIASVSSAAERDEVEAAAAASASPSSSSSSSSSAVAAHMRSSGIEESTDGDVTVEALVDLFSSIDTNRDHSRE